MAGRVVVVPIGDISDLLDRICAAVVETLALECQVGDVIPVPDCAHNARRGQYSADAILSVLRAPHGERALGVVDQDLYVPELNFVFGLADPNERRALIALPRLREEFYGQRENRALFEERAAKEAVHELGHTFGLKHCANRQCVMSFSNMLADTDYKQQAFCAQCLHDLNR